MKTLLAAVVLVVAACTPSIAGFAVGERRCEPGFGGLGPGDHGACSGYRTIAEQDINEDEPSHPPIVRSEVYVDPVVVPHSGAATSAIVAIRLADGTVRAYRISCGVGLATDICVDRAGHTHPAGAYHP